jgi:hypothetical protein
VPLEREGRVLPVHAAAVVGHPDEGEPALLDVDGDRPRARVERVLDELLHHRRGPLHHLARGDLVHEPRGEDVDPRHATPWVARRTHGARGRGLDWTIDGLAGGVYDGRHGGRVDPERGRRSEARASASAGAGARE